MGQVDAASLLTLSNEQSQRLAAGVRPGESGQTVSVFLGNGDGSFQPAIQAVARARGRSMVEGDFNRDGIPDMATVDPNSQSVIILVGNGEGSFKVASILRTGGSQSSVAIADFNRDGIPDLIVAEDTRKHARPRSQDALDPEPNQSAVDSLQPRRVVAMTAGARLANLEAAVVSEATSRTETKPPPDAAKGSDSPGGPGPESEVPGLPSLPVSAPFETKMDLQEPAIGFLPVQRDSSSSPAGQLLAGLLPIDLANLERKVDEFFHRIDQLAEDAAEPETMARLTPWLATCAVLTAAYAFARRCLPRPGASGAMGPGDGSQPSGRAFPCEAWDRVP